MDVPSDMLARLDEIRATLPLSLRYEFDRERDIVVAETRSASSHVSLSVLMAKWQGVAEAEAREPGISHRVLAEVVELVAMDGAAAEGRSPQEDPTCEPPARRM